MQNPDPAPGAAQRPQFKGVPVFMGGQEYIVPSFSVRQYRDHGAQLNEGPKENQPAGDFIASRIPLIGLAMRRNYPDLTDEALLDMVDLQTFREVVRAVQAASGLRVAQPGEEPPVAAT